MANTYIIHEHPHVLHAGFSIIDDLTENEWERLNAMIITNQNLLQQAFSSTISVKKENGEIIFCGFPEDDYRLILASRQFISKLLQYIKGRRHLYLNEDRLIDDKCAFICLMLKIGMIGNEYKSSRYLLAENLSGSSAFYDAG